MSDIEDMDESPDLNPPQIAADAGQLRPVTRRVNVKTGNGRVMGVAREHYLRDDLPCMSELCFEDSCKSSMRDSKASMLPGDVTHYLVPLEDVARHFLDVLERPELRGILLLQSVVNAVQVASLRQYRLEFYGIYRT